MRSPDASRTSMLAAVLIAAIASAGGCAGHPGRFGSHDTPGYVSPSGTAAGQGGLADFLMGFVPDNKMIYFAHD